MEYFRENKSLTMEVIMADKETKAKKTNKKKIGAIIGGVATVVLAIVLVVLKR
jgi:hypothetical protein